MPVDNEFWRHWQPSYLDKYQHDAIYEAWHQYVDYFQLLKLADARYAGGSEWDVSDDIFEILYFLKRNALYPDDHILSVLSQARVYLTEQILADPPQVILVSGESGKKILPVIFGSPLEAALRIPVVNLNSYEKYMLYSHRIGDYPQDYDFHYKHFVMNLTQVVGDFPEHVALLDDAVSGGVKAYHSWVTLKRAGIPKVSVGCLSAPHQTELVPWVGSTDINFWAYMRNLASSVSFIEDSRGHLSEFLASYSESQGNLDELRVQVETALMALAQ